MQIRKRAIFTTLTLFALSIALILALNARAQAGAVCIEQDGAKVCYFDGKVCLVNDDGSMVCRLNPPESSSPIVGGAANTQIFLPLVER